MIIWDDSFSTGIKIIDEQNKYLFHLCRRIEMLLETPNGVYKVDETIKIICDLREYTTFHFYTEENYMKKINFGEFYNHKIDHDKFKNEILSIDMNTIYRENYNEIYSIKHFLYDWIFNHIQIKDREIAEYTNKK